MRNLFFACTVILLLGTLTQCTREAPTAVPVGAGLQVRISFPDEHSRPMSALLPPAAPTPDVDSIRATAFELLDSDSILRACQTVALADSATHFSVTLAVPAADLYRVTVEVFGTRGAPDNPDEGGLLYAGDTEVADVSARNPRMATVALTDLVPQLSAEIDPQVGWRLAWTPVDGVRHYRLRETPDAGPACDFVTTSTDTFIYFPAGFAGSGSGLTAGPEVQSLSYRVRAEWAASVSAFSDSVCVILPAAEAPGPVEDLAATDVGSDFVALAWTAPGDDGNTGRAAGYDLRYSTGTLNAETFSEATSATGLPLPGVPGSADEVTVAGLVPETSYSFAIKAFDEAGLYGEISNVVTVATVDLTPPAAVADLQASDVGTTSLLLSWTAPGDDGLSGQAASYDLRYATGALTATNFSEASPVSAPPAPGTSGSAQSVSVDGLMPETTYEFGIKTTDEAGNVSDLSNVVSVTTQAACALEVTYPNGSEAWVADTVYEIAWIYAGACANSVRIELLQSGEVCRVITESTPNDGEFAFAAMRCQGSEGYTIRIIEEASGAADVSNGTFTIAPIVAPCIITVTSPNGNEILTESTSAEIRWDASGACADSVRIELLEHGAPCAIIAESTANDGRFSWIVAHCDGAFGYSVRITDHASGASDESDNIFIIEPYTPPCAITITTPNGGEVLRESVATDIIWDYSGVCGNSVRIELMQDGTVCEVITDGTDNDGLYSWIAAPCDGSQEYALRITDTASGNADLSDGTFVIEPLPTCAITVTAPNGGENLPEYSLVEITWDHDGTCGDSVRIELIQDGTVCEVITDGTDNDGLYSWTALCCQGSAGYTVRVTDTESGVFDESDSVFTIEPYEPLCSLTVTYPNGGEALSEYTPVTIEWSFAGPCDESVAIDLIRGDSLCAVLSQSTPNSGSFEWFVTTCQQFGDDYRIRVTDLASGLYDESDTTFTIDPYQVACNITLESPNGGETLMAGSTHEIIWSAGGSCGPTAKVELLLDGVNCLTIADEIENSGSFPWTITPCATQEEGYTIRVSDVVLGISDDSDQTFRILGNCALSVTSPTEGDVVCPFGPLQILWTSAGSCAAAVDIELYRDGVLCSALATGTENDGSFLWPAAPYGAPGGTYTIQITESEGSHTALSGAFTFDDECSFSVSAPQEGDAFCVGDAIQIGWDAASCCIPEISIELMVSGFVYHTIAAATPNDGSFTWTAVQHGSPTDVYTIRVSAPQSGASAESGFIFIDAACELTITAPSSDDSFCAGDPAVIAWNSGACCGATIDIELVHGDQVCAPIAFAVPNTGQYLWTSSQCGSIVDGYRIRITDPGCGAFTESDPFEVTPGCAMQLATPNGDEFYCTGDEVAIIWDSSACCGPAVAIDLLLDGVLCDVISADTPNDGLFQWSAAQCAAQEFGYTIRITDLTGGSFDESDLPFRIGPYCVMELTHPAAAATFHIGDMVPIMWNPFDYDHCCGDQVKLELVRAGAVCLTIADPADNIGFYPWEAMPCGSSTTDYRIRVTDLDTGVWDESPVPFMIIP